MLAASLSFPKDAMAYDAIAANASFRSARSILPRVISKHFRLSATRVRVMLNVRMLKFLPEHIIVSDFKTFAYETHFKS